MARLILGINMTKLLERYVANIYLLRRYGLDFSNICKMSVGTKDRETHWKWAALSRRQWEIIERGEVMPGDIGSNFSGMSISLNILSQLEVSTVH